MSYEARVLLAVALIGIVAFFGFGILQSWLGKPLRGTLSIPQGKNRLDITLCDDQPLRPFKYDQVFDVIVLPGTHTAPSAPPSGAPSEYGALAYKGTLIGFADDANSYGRYLTELADTYPTVKASAVVIGLDPQGKPLMQLNLPGAKWFVKALMHARNDKR